MRYITCKGQPAFTEFFADIHLHTLTNPTDANYDGQLDYPYLFGIQDPISWEPTIMQDGHGSNVPIISTCLSLSGNKIKSRTRIVGFGAADTNFM